MLKIQEGKLINVQQQQRNCFQFRGTTSEVRAEPAATKNLCDGWLITLLTKISTI